MTNDPIELLTETIPELFNSAIGEVRAQAAGGNAEATQRLVELEAAAPLAVRVTLEGDDPRDLHVVFERGELRTIEEKPGVPVLFAVAVAHEAFELALEDLAEDLEKAFGKLRSRIPLLTPSRARAGIDRLAKEQLFFHYVVKDTPDFDEVRVKVAVGGSEAPAKPTFTVTVEYDTIEQLRARKLKPQNLLSKVQLTGDSARVMQMVMEAMQRRASR